MSARVDTAPTGSPRLDVAMRHRIGTLAIDVSFALRQPWTVLFGPSGSGKSTILRAIAGLVRSDSARIVLAEASMPGAPGTVIVVDSAAKKFTPTHARSIPLAPQAPSLFPHMSVMENVAYGISSNSREDALRNEMDESLSLFRIAPLAGKRPAELSGGEAQRVNLARAAAAALENRLLLLDEPFSGLDVGLRSELMHDLQAWTAKRNLCVLSVTHDVAEAFQLDAEVIKLAEGRVVEQGPVATVLAEERARLLMQLNGTAGSPA